MRGLMNYQEDNNKRVSIARALAQEAKIILADEPVASLDPLTTKQVLDEFEKN